MKHIIHYTYPIMLAAVVGGCSFATSTGFDHVDQYPARRITSFTDPDFAGSTYRSLVVIADTSDADVGQKLEQECANWLRRTTTVYAGSDLFPPTRIWTDSGRLAAMRAKGVQGYLVIKTKDAGVRQTYIQPRTITTTTKTIRRVPNPKTHGKDSVDIEDDVTETRTLGGEYQRENWGKYEVRLTDMASGRTAWLATRGTAGEYAAWYPGLCADVIYQLRYDNLVLRQNMP